MGTSSLFRALPPRRLTADSLRYVSQRVAKLHAHPSPSLSLSLNLSQLRGRREGGRVNRGIPFHGVYLGKKGADTCDTNVIKFHSTSLSPLLPPLPFPPVYTIYLPILVNAFSSKLYAYVELACTNFIAFTAFESMFERGFEEKKKEKRREERNVNLAGIFGNFSLSYLWREYYYYRMFDSLGSKVWLISKLKEKFIFINAS